MVKSENTTIEDVMLKMYKQDDPCFEALKTRLRGIGMQVCCVELMRRSISCFAINDARGRITRVPYLKLYTMGNTFHRIAAEPVSIGLVSDKARAEVLSIWREVISEYGLEENEFYRAKMYVGVKSSEAYVYEYYARYCKDEIRSVIAQIISKLPDKIYASSTPSINILYSEKDYCALNIDELKNIAIQKIRNAANERIKEMTGCDIYNTLEIYFWHPAMKGYNGYGLSRED